MFSRLGRRIASTAVCICALGWTATAVLLIAACSEGAQDRPMGEGLTPTVTQWAEPRVDARPFNRNPYGDTRSRR